MDGDISYQKTVLSSGLRVLTCTLPHIHSVCIGIFIGTGSRYEKERESGISHFIEHLCFKGTEQRRTAKEISETIEGVGGVLNGATDKELTVYWCKVTPPHFLVALDVLADMLRHSRFDSQDIEKERQVIIEELNLGLDSPQRRVDALIDELLWPNQPLGRDVAGSKQTVAAIRRQDILNYFSRQYLPNDAVISISGNITHDKAVAKVGDTFGDWQQGVSQLWYPANDNQQVPQLCVETRETEDAHLCLAVHGLPLGHSDRFVLDLLNVVLGEGMSSRLFAEIRERRGLAYAVYSSVDYFLDSGSLSIYAGVAPKNLSTAIEAIVEQLRRLKQGITDAELVKAKELYKGRLLLRLEDTRNVTSWLGGQELLLGRVFGIDEVISVIDSIQAYQLERLARELLATEKLNLAIVGPISNEGHLKELLQL
jgi:predicted Zn-dependent peptidase